MELKNPVTGIKQYYEEAGGGGPPVVLVHGWTGNCSRWGRVPGLLAANRRVIVYELRGHARSDKGPELDYSFGAHVADLAGVMDTLGLGKAVIVGHSMGGMIAQLFALEHPDRVEKLVLIATAPGMAADDKTKRKLKIVVWVFRHFFSLATWIKDGKKRKAPDLYPDVHDRALRSTAVVASASLENIMNLDIRDRLKEIKLPALVIATDTDEQVPFQMTKELAALLPSARFHEIKGSSHQIPIECSEEVVNVIQYFIEKSD